MESDIFDFWSFFDNVNSHTRRQRIIRERKDPISDYDEYDFKRRFRMKKSSFYKLLGIIENELEFVSERNNPVPPALQLLTTLRFFACGSFQQVCGDLTGISQPTVSRIIKRVSTAIANMRPQYIKFPSREETVKVSHASDKNKLNSSMF